MAELLHGLRVEAEGFQPGDLGQLLLNGRGGPLGTLMLKLQFCQVDAGLFHVVGLQASCLQRLLLAFELSPGTLHALHGELCLKLLKYAFEVQLLQAQFQQPEHLCRLPLSHCEFDCGNVTLGLQRSPIIQALLEVEACQGAGHKLIAWGLVTKFITQQQAYAGSGSW